MHTRKKDYYSSANTRVNKETNRPAELPRGGENFEALTANSSDSSGRYTSEVIDILLHREHLHCRTNACQSDLVVFKITATQTTTNLSFISVSTNCKLTYNNNNN